MSSGYQPRPTEFEKKLHELRKKLNLPYNVNPTREQMEEAGIVLPRPPAPPAPPPVPRSSWPSICDSVGGDLGPEFGPDKVRVVLGDVKLTNQDLIHVASMSPALMMVVNERREQIEKHRHTQGLDRAYRHEELAFASACYIIPSFGHTGRLSYWPWTAATFKPAKVDDQPGNHPQIKARIKDLTKGLALGLAELERLTAFLKELEDE